MLCYHYDCITKEYLYSSECVLDPLETEQTGTNVWLLPANATFVEPPSVNNNFIPVWRGTDWIKVEDHRGTKYWLPEDTCNSEPREMQNLGPLPEGATLTSPNKTNIEECKIAKVLQIDQETSSNILAGFDYSINGTSYHFSYDTIDQQNFVDTVSMCQLSLLDTSGVPATITWNSYLADGTLVQHQFDAKTFIDLYVNGAMKHKATQMTLGGQRKLAVEKAQTIEEVEKI